MNRKSTCLIAISLVFAGLMIGISMLIGDQEAKQLVTFLLIAVWWIPFSILTRDDSCCQYADRE